VRLNCRTITFLPSRPQSSLHVHGVALHQAPSQDFACSSQTHTDIDTEIGNLLDNEVLLQALGSWESMTYMQSQQGKWMRAKSTTFPNLPWDCALRTSSSGMRITFISLSLGTNTNTAQLPQK
jgi:hypothetical protein